LSFSSSGSPPPIRLPPPAGPGDRVGVAALSGPVDAERLERGLAALRGLGFEPVVADNVGARGGRFAGGDAERLAAFHRLAGDADLPVIMFARGGSGLLRVLPGIDWGLLRRRPRAYVGFSDLTPFLLAVAGRLGLAAFHGPMAAVDLARGLDDAERESLLGALAGRYPLDLRLGRGGGAAAVLRPGRASGPLLGGCLSLLAATLGTPYFPDLSGAVLFWEDTGEPPYKIDRMLTHLSLSGNLDRIGGMIIGHLDATEAAAGPIADTPEARSMEAAPEWRSLIEDSLSGYSWPLVLGLDAGHGSPNLTLPLGLPARLEAGGRGGELLALG